MDSGYLATEETLEDNYDVLKELLPEEVIGIMDQMLCHEVGFCQHACLLHTITMLGAE